MGCKYLGETFDIHGGGMDLMFPHHESEIAQSMAANGKQPVVYWMHNNMITIGGQKMGKSLGNFITLDEFFNGSHINAKGEEMIAQPYSPMTIRFFILQAHYRSTLDFSNEALQAAEKGYNRLMEAVKAAKSLKATDGAANLDIQKIVDACYDAMNDDFNSPIVIANLFEAVRIVNTVKDGKAQINAEELTLLNKLFQDFVFDILGLVESGASEGNGDLVDGLMQTIIDIRKQARANKDWATSDLIRDELAKYDIVLKDGKEGTTWSLK
jgi:cysteinyl-tRNA synthetase